MVLRYGTWKMSISNVCFISSIARNGALPAPVELKLSSPGRSLAYRTSSGTELTGRLGGTTITKAVTSVTWTADAGVSLKPGEFGEFELSAGPVPAVESLAFPTTQTYSDGKVVQWNEPTPASGEEPENPVPTLTVTPAVTGAGDAHGQGAEASASAAGTPATATVSDATVSAAASTSAAAPSDGTSSATILAVVSLVVAAASLVVAAVALRRRPTGGAGR